MKFTAPILSSIMILVIKKYEVEFSKLIFSLLIIAIFILVVIIIGSLVKVFVKSNKEKVEEMLLFLELLKGEIYARESVT